MMAKIGFFLMFCLINIAIFGSPMVSLCDHMAAVVGPLAGMFCNRWSY
jgi:hypothetical protein